MKNRKYQRHSIAVFDFLLALSDFLFTFLLLLTESSALCRIQNGSMNWFHLIQMSLRDIISHWIVCLVRADWFSPWDLP